MLKEIDCFASSMKKILSDYTGEISADAVKKLSLFTKYGTNFSEELKDASERENAAVVLNLAADDKKAPINAYLAANKKEKMAAALQAVAKAVHASEIYIVKPKDISFDFTNSFCAVKVVETERSLVFREESAVYNLIASGEIRSCPLEKQFPSEGCKGRPTVMIDAETLCKIYAAVQTDYMDTKLIVLQKGEEELLAEIKTGVSLQTILQEAGWKPEKSVLLGGVMGEFLSQTELEQQKVFYNAKWDMVRVYTEKDCLADASKKLADQAREESCQKCVLCREGTWHFQNILQDVVSGKAKKDDLAMILDIGPLIQVGAFCSFGQNMAKTFVSSVEKNREELEAHFVKKNCPAGVCKAFAKMVINPAKCTGCGDCIDMCEEDAIQGKRKFIHIIDPDLCENCGKCADVCEEGAIVRQDGSIRVPKKLMKAGTFK